MNTNAEALGLLSRMIDAGYTVEMYHCGFTEYYLTVSGHSRSEPHRTYHGDTLAGTIMKAHKAETKLAKEEISK